jgi:chromosome segregation ATPase
VAGVEPLGNGQLYYRLEPLYQTCKIFTPVDNPKVIMRPLVSRREAEALREQVARLEPDAAAYAAVKDRSAGVELEAHRRAQGVLDQANSQARHLRQQMEQWMTRVGREYDALRTEVEATISHAADQLDKAGKCLEQVSALLSDQDVALEELSRAYDSTAPDKVPAPVPLEEEP